MHWIAIMGLIVTTAFHAMELVPENPTFADLELWAATAIIVILSVGPIAIERSHVRITELTTRVAALESKE